MSTELTKAEEAARNLAWQTAQTWALIAIAKALEERNEGQSLKIDTANIASGYYGVGGYGAQDR